MKYICSVCGYIYDESSQAVSFSDLPNEWVCPLCGAPKALFNVKEEEKTQVEFKAIDEDLTELSIGQLAALCSNLARGCRKQYKQEETLLFDKLSDYFTASVKPIDDVTVEKLATKLSEDIDLYPSVRATVDSQKDRGAARVCVWGDKVTRILESLVSRYLKEGEKMLEGKNVYVCSVCGFVYIGDKAPDLCPVCKFPSWKFDKVEGR